MLGIMLCVLWPIIGWLGRALPILVVGVLVLAALAVKKEQ